MFSRFAVAFLSESRLTVFVFMLLMLTASIFWSVILYNVSDVL